MFIFEKFPKIKYETFDGVVEIKDLTKRFKFVDEVLSNKYVLHSYYVKENETAQIIADRYYKDSTLDWIILLSNKIFDPYFGWPMSSKEFSEYIVKKYGTIEYASQNYYKRYMIIQKAQRTYDGFFIPEERIEVDSTYYTTLAEENRKRLTFYQWEEEENEKRRKLKIIDKAFIPQIKENFKGLF